MIIRQVIDNWRREWTWTIFYTVVMTVAAMGIFMLVISFSSISKKARSLQSFVKKNVVLLQMQPVSLQPTQGGQDPARRLPSASPDLKAFLQNAFSSKGHAGSFFELPAGRNLPYDTICVLLGEYSSLQNLSYEGSIAVFVPPSHQEDVGKTIRLGNQDLIIQSTCSPNFMIYHPILPYGFGEGEKYIVLCSRDFDTIRQMFLHDTHEPVEELALEHLVLVNPSDEELQEIQTKLYKTLGRLYRGITTADFMKTTTIADLRATQLYLSYYVLCSIILVLLAITNIIRMVEANITEYTIHYIYGASLSQLRWQVACFTLTLHILPMVGIGHLILINHLKGASFFPLALAFVLGLSYGMGRYAEKRVGNLRTIQNLRRDYE